MQFRVVNVSLVTIPFLRERLGMTMEECKSDTPPYYTTCLFSLLFFSYYGTMSRYRLRRCPLSLESIFSLTSILHGSLFTWECCLRCYVPYDNDDLAFLHAITFYIRTVMCIIIILFFDIYL